MKTKGNAVIFFNFDVFDVWLMLWCVGCKSMLKGVGWLSFVLASNCLVYHENKGECCHFLKF